MKASAVAKSLLTEVKANEIFEVCEKMVCGITIGTSVPLQLNITDLDIIQGVVFNTIKDLITLENRTDLVVRTIQNRASGLCIKWFKQKGRML